MAVTSLGVHHVPTQINFISVWIFGYNFGEINALNVVDLGEMKKDQIKTKKRNCFASSVNRTRASSMATTNSTTRPMMLQDTVILIADSPLMIERVQFNFRSHSALLYLLPLIPHFTAFPVAALDHCLPIQQAACLRQHLPRRPPSHEPISLCQRADCVPPAPSSSASQRPKPGSR